MPPASFQGLGLIDAISNEDLEAQYKAESEHAELNPAFWDNSAKKLKDDAYAEDAFGKKFVKRFNYDLLEGCLENDVALWDELNILRSDIKHICSTTAWAKAMSENENVINTILKDGKNASHYLHPYYYDGTKEGVKEALSYLLSPSDDVNLYDNKYYNFEPEMTDDQYHSFIVWHRGIAVPRARDLNDSQVQRGKELFFSMGCTNCHKASWTTGHKQLRTFQDYRRQEIATIRWSEDLSLFRLHPAQAGHDKRHSWVLVSHHSALGAWPLTVEQRC